MRLKEKKIIDRRTAILKLEMLCKYGRYDEKMVQDIRKRLED